MNIFSIGLLGGGFVVGAASAATGIGWGVLIVPLLLLHPAITPQQAVAVSLLSFLFNGAAASVQNFRNGFVVWEYVLLLGVGGMAGAWGGAYLLRVVSPQLLERVIAVAIIVIGVRMLLPRGG